MIGRVQTNSAAGGQHPLFWPFIISLIGHMALFGVILFNPRWHEQQSWSPSVIDVQMVDLSEVSAAPAAKSKSTADKAPVVEKSEPVETEPEPVKTEATAEARTEAEPEVSLARPEPKAKTALKYKTYKPKNVLKRAIDRLEQEVAKSPPKPLEDTIKRLREQVAREDRPPGDKQGTGTGEESVAIGGKSGPGGRQAAELVNLYQLDIAGQINKNWAFAGQLADGNKNLVASVTFRVLSDGTIEDIFFVDHSGNAYLDDSAYRAIVKSSPVKPFPPGMSQTEIRMGLRFTPQGVQ